MKNIDDLTCQKLAVWAHGTISGGRVPEYADLATSEPENRPTVDPAT